MALIEWTPQLEVGFPEIDDQHQHLIQLMNGLHAAIEERQAQEALDPVLTDLLNYTLFHFRMEENLMAEHAYAGEEAHVARHRQFFEDVMAFHARKDLEAARLPAEILAFLKTWLLEHIQGTDARLAAFLREAGRGSAA